MNKSVKNRRNSLSPFRFLPLIAIKKQESLLLKTYFWDRRCIHRNQFWTIEGGLQWKWKGKHFADVCKLDSKKTSDIHKVNNFSDVSGRKNCFWLFM